MFDTHERNEKYILFITYSFYEWNNDKFLYFKHSQISKVLASILSS